jgi:hypothetical protein
MNNEAFCVASDYHGVIVWLVFKSKIILSEYDGHVGSVGLDIWALDTHVLHPSLEFLLLSFVCRFEASNIGNICFTDWVMLLTM